MPSEGSQSPRIGAVIRMAIDLVVKAGAALVSIPSNRGSHSNVNGEEIDQLESVCLNPLESGQSFEYAHGFGQR